MSLVLALLGAFRASLRTRTDLALENLALRQQLALLRRRSKQPQFGRLDRLFWVWLSHQWAGWREALHVVRPETVIRWHRQGFRAFWTWKSRRGRVGRPRVSSELADLVRTMALANPLWGSPRIHGELLKLGLEVSQRTIARLIPRRPKPPSQTWRTFLQNHLADLVSVDFFVVPTATFRVLYVFVVLLQHRRRVVHFSVTDSPTAAWTAQQIVEAFPDDSAPRYLLRDRDNIYRCEFRRRVGSMGIAEVLTAPCSPWQNPYAERMIGTIRRELLDHVIVIDERHLRHQLHRYLRYYHGSRTHLSLAKDAPEPRAVEHPELGRVVALPQVGGLHHRYTRCTRPGYFLEPRRSCSRGLLLLILCGDVRCTRAVDGGAVPFARIACGRERASPTATGGCEEQAAAQASDVQGLAALDDRATDEVDSFVAGDGDAGAAGYGASVAPEGIPPSVAMAVWNSRPKTDALRDADPRDDGAKP